jgi:tRNA(Ile)-lysidine synthase
VSPLLDAVRDAWPQRPWRDSKIVVAVSGGPDSVCLLHALLDINDGCDSLIVAHFDHGLRGAESDADRRFVVELATQCKLPVECGRATPFAGRERSPSEERLRHLRHQFLRSVAEQHSASWVATGHHADDCIETFLHHLLRGSGPSGLSSIAPTRCLASGIQLVHPMLSVSKTMILEHLTQHQIPYRVDASNQGATYTRNRIRHELLPYLRQFIGTPHLDRRLWNASQLIREEHAVIEGMAREWLASASVVEGADFVEFPASACCETAWPIVREGLVGVWHRREWSLRGMTARHWNRLRLLLERSRQTPHPLRMQLPGKIQVTMRRERLRFTRHAEG